MALFENGELGEFLLFVQNINITFLESWTLETGVKIQYICTLVRGEALREFDSLSEDVEGLKPLTMVTIIIELTSYFFV